MIQSCSPGKQQPNPLAAVQSLLTEPLQPVFNFARTAGTTKAFDFIDEAR
jgi:hypothetical protein